MGVVYEDGCNGGAKEPDIVKSSANLGIYKQNGMDFCQS